MLGLWKQWCVNLKTSVTMMWNPWKVPLKPYVSVQPKLPPRVRPYPFTLHGALSMIQQECIFTLVQGIMTSLCLFLDTLGPASKELNYFQRVLPSISVEDQFFLTLIKLRQCKTNFELSRMFSIQEASVTNIFVTWINFMALQWEETDWWPSQDMVHFYAPSDFKLKFPSTRVIIDGTECPIMKPQEPLAQQATFSSYKNRNTVKVLAGLSPGGLITYISPAYGGAASDRQICERSTLMTQCCASDSIMSDKGFNVQDLFESAMVTINIPSFFSKKNRMSGGNVLKDRKIASKRIHAERIIGLAKTYKILKKPLNQTESILASQIIKVCFYLCNLRATIVSREA